jgi:hypothetical protein
MALEFPALKFQRAAPPPTGLIVSSDITLQINLSAGDVAYARQTVPALVHAHPGVAARLAVVDCCRPQRTRIYDPNTRVPAAPFAEKVGAIRQLAADLLRAGLLDRVEYLMPGDPRFAALARRYVRPWMTETHDYGGCAFMGYWAALEFPATRFVLHYDADMCLYQELGFDWAAEARRLWDTYPQAVAATPRISPPGFAPTPADDAPSAHEGRPLERVSDGWLNDWFSTRCFLCDRERLAPHLPLVRGLRTLEYRLRRRIDRGYPIGPESLLHLVLGRKGLRRLNLADPRAWLLHPNRKPPAYHAMLPAILSAVQAGRVPDAQRGHSDLDLNAWTTFLAAT